MKKRALFVLCLIGAVLAGVSAASALTSGGGKDSAPGSIEPSASADHTASAQTRSPNGGNLGVAGFQTRDGRRCAAYGYVRDGKVGANSERGFQKTPLAQTGLCVGDPPATFSRVFKYDNPQTPNVDESETVVWGVAEPGVQRLNIRTVGFQTTALPASDGTFIVAAKASPDAALSVEVVKADGSTETLTLEAPPKPPAVEDIRSGKVELNHGDADDRGEARHP